VKELVAGSTPNAIVVVQKHKPHTTPHNDALAGGKNRMAIRSGNNPVQPIHGQDKKSMPAAIRIELVTSEMIKSHESTEEETRQKNPFAMRAHRRFGPHSGILPPGRRLVQPTGKYQPGPERIPEN